MNGIFEEHIMKKWFLMLVAACAFQSAWAAVDLNTANQAQLESVTGIGPAKAKAIIDYRSKNGPFKSLEDLEKVDGFGKKSIEKMKAELSVGKPAAAPAAVKPAAATPAATPAAAQAQVKK
jgi:competence protein ComEA